MTETERLTILEFTRYVNLVLAVTGFSLSIAVIDAKRASAAAMVGVIAVFVNVAAFYAYVLVIDKYWMVLQPNQVQIWGAAVRTQELVRAMAYLLILALGKAGVLAAKR